MVKAKPFVLIPGKENSQTKTTTKKSKGGKRGKTAYLTLFVPSRLFH